ncbi:MAG: acyltransferase family protein [Acidimicrobiales bacterium]
MHTNESAALSRHVPALDGVRAVGMAAMLMYHGQVGSKGAFLALSQFFTLSGFLVMSILLRRLEHPDGLRVMGFWGRRYRRLMPASLLTLAGVILFGFTLATEQQVDALRSSIPAALGQVVNWHFVVTDASYVDLFTSPSPIQHFWSLAVEEQFYLLTPLLLLAVIRFTRDPRVLAIGFAVAAFASTAWMYWLFEDGASIDRLYYGTDTRAAEMLLGCLLAIVLQHRRPVLGRGGRYVLGFAGLAAYAASVWAFFSVTLTDGRMYRGGFLTFSLLSCIVVYSLVEDAGPLSRLLGLRPLAALGRITYGVYLFHWPLMLALTEDRTGLDGWWLFALQVSVSLALAALSAKYFEAPIRYGRAPAGNLRFPIAIVGTAVVLAGAGLALHFRNVDTDLGGLGERAGEAPPVIDDGPMVVVVIGDTPGLTYARDTLGPAAAASEDVEIAATVSFGCSSSSGTACPDTERWADLIETHDPDVVFLDARAWEGTDAFASASSDDLGVAADWVRAQLAPGFDILTSKGATVVWGQGEASTIEDGIRAARDPFFVAMNDLTSNRSDMRRMGVVQDATKTIADLELYARRDEGTLPRVLVVGDSVSRTIGYGLERWAADRDTAVVWSAGTEGCGVARGGVFVDTSGRETEILAACNAVWDGWTDQIRQFDPDIVIVISNAADFRERRLDGWDGRREPGDPVFDEYLIDEYVQAYDVLSAGGATVTWVIPPCASDVFGVFDEPDGGNATDDDRIRYIGEELIPRVVEERPRLQTFDLFAVMCPDGDPINAAEGTDDLRPDGIHFSSPGSLWLAETVGDDLLVRVDP